MCFSDEYDEQIQSEKAHFRDLEKEVIPQAITSLCIYIHMLCIQIKAMERKISQHHKQMGGCVDIHI